MADDDKKGFENLIRNNSNEENKDTSNKKFDTFSPLSTPTDSKSDKPKSSLVSPNAPKINIDRASRGPTQPTSLNNATDRGERPFDSTFVPGRTTTFSVKNPNKTTAKEKPENLDIFQNPYTTPEPPKTNTRSTITPNIPNAQKRTVDKPKPNSTEPNKTSTTPFVNIGDLSKPKASTTTTGTSQTPTQSDVFKVKTEPTPKEQPKAPVTLDKPLRQDEGADKPKVEILKREKDGEQVEAKPTKQAQATQDTQKTPEPEIHKTTTSSLKRKDKEIPEDQSLEIGAQAGSENYQADKRLDKHAKSLKKYNKEYEKWRRSQGFGDDDEEDESGVRVLEGRKSERLITIALIIVVIIILSMFLLFYCNVLAPQLSADDRVRISVEIDKDTMYDVSVNGNVDTEHLYPGDYLNFEIRATNAYNIKGDNATSYVWDSIFVRFKVYLRIDGVEYENIDINMSGEQKNVPVLVPAINNTTFQHYDRNVEANYRDPVTDLPIVQDDDGYYYYNGILSYNQSITLCTGILINGDAIIPDFANKRCELVVTVDAATADYTSIRERTIWNLAPQSWIEYMHNNYFSYL